jgi:hypothetical protein
VEFLPRTRLPDGGRSRAVRLPVGREAGFVVHSLRHFFETFTVNAGVPQRVIDTWLGHRSDKSMAAVYYRLRDEDSQAFMTKVPFGTGSPAADAGTEGNRFAVGWMALVVAGWSGVPDRDKTGTTGGRVEEVESQPLKNKEPAAAGSLNAERAGHYLGFVASHSPSTRYS